MSATLERRIVYELFFTNLPQEAFMACEVVALYLHRGADLPVLADEDQELDEGLAGAAIRLPDSKHGKSSVNGSPKARLELGHQLEPTELRTTEFALAVHEAKEQQAASRAMASPRLPHQ